MSSIVSVFIQKPRSDLNLECIQNHFSHQPIKPSLSCILRMYSIFYKYLFKTLLRCSLRMSSHNFFTNQSKTSLSCSLTMSSIFFSVIFRKPRSDVVAECHHIILLPLTNHKLRIVVAPECFKSLSVFTQKPRSDVVPESLQSFTVIIQKPRSDVNSECLQFFFTNRSTKTLFSCSLTMSSILFQ